jgi:hypothetical protein
MDAVQARPLTPAEAAALSFMLTPDFPGFEQLRAQARNARVVGRCSCGCASIDIAVDRANTPPALAASPGVAATATSRDPRVTHLMLWVDGDYLSGLELSWVEMTDEFPPPEMFDPPERG